MGNVEVDGEMMGLIDKEVKEEGEGRVSVEWDREMMVGLRVERAWMRATMELPWER